MMGGKNLQKSLVLIFLIIILSLAGLLWFDYLGIIQAKKIFAPIYKLFGLRAQTSVTVTNANPLNTNIDQDRIDKQREALQLFKEELDKRESDLNEVQTKSEQLSNEMLEREKMLEEREKTFNSLQKKYDDKEVNIENIATNLYSMQPAKAVGILEAMDDQLVIDVLRKEEELATQNNQFSMSSYWLSLMKPERAATIQRKMVSKPKELN